MARGKYKHLSAGTDMARAGDEYLSGGTDTVSRMGAALSAVAATIRTGDPCCYWHGFLRRVVGHAAILGVGRSLDREAKRWDV
jgi:hypothetical protein